MAKNDDRTLDHLIRGSEELIRDIEIQGVHPENELTVPAASSLPEQLRGAVFH